jgi:hypothetical protein
MVCVKGERWNEVYSRNGFYRKDFYRNGLYALSVNNNEKILKELAN